MVGSYPVTQPIIGDRGRGESPNSSDGVAAYWSSHLPGAQSELIVPGPHDLRLSTDDCRVETHPAPAFSDPQPFRLK
jgi:hypothetical protein